jgi:hypothetical protein
MFNLRAHEGLEVARLAFWGKITAEFSTGRRARRLSRFLSRGLVCIRLFPSVPIFDHLRFGPGCHQSELEL